jgi:hypothetical protein
MVDAGKPVVVELGIEFVVELLLFLYPYGADQMNLPHNFWLGLGCWVVGTAIFIRMFWIFPAWAHRLTKLEKGLIAFILVAGFIAAFYKPVLTAYAKRNGETEIKLMSPPTEKDHAPESATPPKVTPIPTARPRKERPSIFTNPVISATTPSNSLGDVKPGDCSTVQNGGSGNIAAPCSNITLEKPEPRFHWTQAERTIEQGGDPAHPSVTIVLTLDGGNMTNAAFLALCDRPCKTVDGGAGASGAHQANYLSTANNKIVGLHINVPPVVLSTQEVWWHIISLDSEPIHVIEIERLPPEKLAKGL